MGGTAAALRTLRVGARDMLKQYADALELAQGLTRIALEKAHGRTGIQMCTLTAHLAKLTGIEREAGQLPRPLREYFAGPDAKVCMRCHCDRPGLRRALERKDEHPYTYICAGCHDDAIAEFRPDLASQMERWTERAREARVIQHALGRPSKLMAAHTVMRRLSGLPEHPPQIAPAKPLGPPLPGPMPSPDARHGIVSTESSVPDEAEYIATLFAPGTVRNSW